MSSTVLEPTPAAAPKPLTEGKQSIGLIVALWAFVLIPFAALIAAVPVAWGWGMSWLDASMALVMYVIGGLGTWSWQGALTGLFWAGLVRIAVLHHVTWSINSICHVYGERPFATRDGDKATNFWPLAILSFGESWHNLHHADPTCARHGVDKGQIDINARLIWIFEKLGCATEVRWPNAGRLDGK